MQDPTIVRPLPKISPSSIADLDCIKKFHTLRVLGQWPKDTNGFAASAQFGSGVHSVLKNLYDPRNPNCPDLEKVDVYARQAFLSWRYPDDLSRQNDIDKCVSIVRHYAEQDDVEDALDTIAVERSGEFIITHQDRPLIFLTAKLDRAIARRTEPTHLVIRDYKLGQPRIKLEETFIQLWAAKLMFPEFKTYSAEIDWIDGDGRVERDVITTDQLKGVYPVVMKRIIRVVTAIDADNIMAEPGDVCSFCALKTTCQPKRFVDMSSAASLVNDLGSDAEIKEVTV